MEKRQSVRAGKSFGVIWLTLEATKIVAMKGVDEEPCIFLILANIAALLLRWKYSFFPHKRNLSGLAEFFWNLVRHLLICLRMGWWL